MDKKWIGVIVVGALLVVSEVVGHIRIGGRAGREAMERLEAEWDERDGEYEMEMERLAGEDEKLRMEWVEVKGRMDTLRAEWAVRGKKVSSIEDWFKGRGR